jgi:putative membrane protein
MPGALTRLLITAIAVVVAAHLLPGDLSVGGVGSLLLSVGYVESVLLFALVLAFLNALVRPVLLVLTLPLNLITLGLFTFVINAIVFWLAAQFPLGVYVSGLGGAFLAALIVSTVSFVLSRAVP